MRPHYKLTIDAEKSLTSVYKYSLLNFGSEQADRYYLSLHETLQLLAEQPTLGRVFKDYRRHEHQRHTIFYKQMSYGILVVKILHHNENVENKFL